MEFFDNIALGLHTALSLNNLLYCFLGVFLGMLVGVIPGIGTLAAISLLFPMTFHLDIVAALVMLAGIWYGTSYGGSTASILLNLPGNLASAVTCLDGYPMARQGRGGVALFMTTIASFIGGSIGIIVLMVLSPTIAAYAIRFGSHEYFALMTLGLVAACAVSDGSVVRALIMVVVGVAFGTVGMDMQTGAMRFTFGSMNLIEGVSLVALALGVFGVTEVITSVRRVKVEDIDRNSVKLRAMIPTRDDVRRSWMPVLRGSAIGTFFGTLPGTGPAIASFMSYAVEKKVAKDPSRLGKGAIEGIMGPESANNAADQTSFIPTLSLGVPGSPSMALMIGALMIHGITPGPSLITDQPALFWGLVMSFWIGNIILVILNIPLIGIWVRILMIPYHLLYPGILAFVCVGAYSIANNAFDVWMVIFFGAFGYLMRVLDLPAAPLLLGFVLGPLMELHFRRAMVMSSGDLTSFVLQPISATVLALTLALLLWNGWSAFRRYLGKSRQTSA